ncbi:chorismate mutase [Acetobacterium carbinolicum]|uniref:chorismate mutase n=1 Tax=Acetobacterium TaxID=33951 RepID=UPI000DBEB768|nr:MULTISPECIES: chorismate mutase [unclassified Acetobacterium]AWW26516.1 chorismate mutase [Acetobacterium sp. KB-1]MDK2942138.1 chorismate mutase [Acetobacterium sp.]MDZ5724765.1 chorismate mutase [Acetobacterium sp. K1/6]
MKTLDEIRNKIDQIDAQMRVLFEQRMDCIQAVAEYKYNNNGNIFDQSREEKMLQKNLEQLKNKNYDKEYERFLEEILISSKDYQKDYIQKKETLKRGE